MGQSHSTKHKRVHPPRYFTAPISFAFARPWSKLIALGLSFISSSLRRSHFRAVRTTRTPGQFSLISAIHFDETFSNESGLSTCIHAPVSPACCKKDYCLTLKQSMSTCVSSYDSARNRSNSSWPAVSHSESSTCILSTKISGAHEYCHSVAGEWGIPWT